MLNNNVNQFNRAWYHTHCDDFLKASDMEIIGHLAQNSANDGFELVPEQADAWKQEIIILKSLLQKYTLCEIFLEFNIPRMGRRIDAVILFEKSNVRHVIVLEFKIGEKTFKQNDIAQVWDYALDLKNFHEGSHSAKIIPILVASEAKNDHVIFDWADDGIAKPLIVGIDGLKSILDKIFSDQNTTQPISSWENTPYRPTPNIIEAARVLYSEHLVENITRNDAGAKNIQHTSSCVEAIISEAAEQKKKIICFVTGVPGAGKTLVGLNVATKKRDENSKTHAVFLSGNGPLVAVLNEALVRDELKRLTAGKIRGQKGKIAQKVKSFIQNVHHFRDEGVRDEINPPSEHVVIFDEAQRAWNKQMTVNFMRRKKKIANFNMSEPEFLISYMDRHKDWAVIVCLVGGGQEINTGEAGIGAWIEAVNNTFSHWDIYVSNNIIDSEYAAIESLNNTQRQAIFKPELHLNVAMRSFRSEKVSGFVKALLDIDIATAQTTLRGLLAKYPIVITRNLHDAKRWLRDKARGSERFGMLASSKAMRLKPFAIDVKTETNPVHYFLDEKDDPRSSYYLEYVATEFQVQGLEVDWACVAWDGDFRATANGWSFHDFRGGSWQDIHNASNQSYLKNAYRVLLTRARQGIVIFVPNGNNPPDHTRKSEYLDPTYNYLRSLGIQDISGNHSIIDRGY